MQIISLYHTTGISGYGILKIRIKSKHGKEVELTDEKDCRKAIKRENRMLRKGSGGRMEYIITIQRTHAVCPHCGSDKAEYYKASMRRIQCQPFGRLNAFVELDVHRIYCPECRARTYEHLEFLSNPRSRITRSFEKEIVDAQHKMSITDVARLFGVSRQTVRDLEIRALERRYRWVPLRGVKRIGIDEICVFHREHDGWQYVTVVRDLDAGRVLNVSRGKEEAALNMFASRLKRLKGKAEIECVAMDMSNAYANFVAHNLPGAAIVYGHFHVIKMINDVINKLRRTAMAQINAQTRKELDELDRKGLELEIARKLEKEINARRENARSVLKGNMKLPLMNKEDLEKDAKAKARLDRMLAEHSDLNAAYLLKGKLRSTYANAKDALEAKPLLEAWIAEAKASGVRRLSTMSNTLEKNLEGVLGFWKHAGATNAKTEGFNNKIR